MVKFSVTPRVVSVAVNSDAKSRAVSMTVNTGKVAYLGAMPFETDETLYFKNGVLGVNTADEVETDNTLPITSAAVSKTVGNIEILLKTI